MGLETFGWKLLGGQEKQSLQLCPGARKQRHSQPTQQFFRETVIFHMKIIKAPTANGCCDPTDEVHLSWASWDSGLAANFSNHSWLLAHIHHSDFYNHINWEHKRYPQNTNILPNPDWPSQNPEWFKSIIPFLTSANSFIYAVTFLHASESPQYYSKRDSHLEKQAQLVRWAVWGHLQIRRYQE